MRFSLRLVDIIAAVPPEHKKTLLPKLKAKPVRTASGIAVVAVMCKPHRCPHISMTGRQIKELPFRVLFPPKLIKLGVQLKPNRIGRTVSEFLNIDFVQQATSACIALAAPTLTLSTLHSPTQATSPPL